MQDPVVIARLRRRALLRRVAIVGALLVVLITTALLWPRPQPGALSVSTTSSTVKPTGVLQGELEASRHGSRACYTVTVRGTTAVLRFVKGWSANERLGLLDPSGAVVAVTGDEPVLLGAPGPVGTVAGCPERGRVWTITQLRQR